MSTRSRGNFLYGTLSGFNTTQTTFTGTGFPNNIATGSYLPIVINPGYNGATASGEIVYVTGVAGNVITVSGSGGNRLSFEGTSATSGSTGTQWIAGPLASDFGLANQVANGDFPVPASGKVLVGTSASGAAFTSTVSGLTINNATISGSTIGPGNSLTYSDITPGSNGQILITSGTSTIWKSPGVFNSGVQTGTAVLNTYNSQSWVTNSPNPVCTTVLSGYTTYLIQGRTTVISNNTTTRAVCSLQFNYLAVTGGTYPLVLGPTNVLMYCPLNTGNQQAEMSVQYVWQAPDRNAYTIYLMAYEGTSANLGVLSQYGLITALGIG